MAGLPSLVWDFYAPGGVGLAGPAPPIVGGIGSPPRAGGRAGGARAIFKGKTVPSFKLPTVPFKNVEISPTDIPLDLLKKRKFPFPELRGLAEGPGITRGEGVQLFLSYIAISLLSIGVTQLARSLAGLGIDSILPGLKYLGPFIRGLHTIPGAGPPVFWIPPVPGIGPIA